MRWPVFFCLLIPALLISACGKPNAGEKLAVISWEKALEAHPQQTRLRKLREEYDLLLAKRREQEVFGKTQMSGLARLQQLKQNSRRSFLAADFQTQMAERQAAEQERLKVSAQQAEQSVAQEFAGEETRLEEQYRLRLFNLRLKLDSLRLTEEERRRCELELAQAQAARERDRAALLHRKRARMDQLMEPEIQAMQQRMDAFAVQLRAQMAATLRSEQGQESTALREAPILLDRALEVADRELDRRQQAVEALERSITKDVESAVTKLARERGYTVVFHKYRTNVTAEDITPDVLSELSKISAKRDAAEALSQKGGSTAAGNGEP